MQTTLLQVNIYASKKIRTQGRFVEKNQFSKPGLIEWQKNYLWLVGIGCQVRQDTASPTLNILIRRQGENAIVLTGCFWSGEAYSNVSLVGCFVLNWEETERIKWPASLTTSYHSPVEQTQPLEETLRRPLSGTQKSEHPTGHCFLLRDHCSFRDNSMEPSL